MRKHRYGYLEEIVVRRADNILYRFKEGDFPRLRMNDIEDMLILMLQDRLTNLSGDDVADFAIALRMFTRSLVIQKRVEDLQLGILTDSKEHVKMVMERQCVKVKEIQEEYALLSFSRLSYQEKYEHVGPEVTSSRDGKVYKMVKRDYAWLMISKSLKILIHVQVKHLAKIQKSLSLHPNHKLMIEVKDYGAQGPK
ncbi:hypothetical protein Tco_1280268 [Tanacetum coccineum]